MSDHELSLLRTFIDENLARGFIRPSKSPLGAPVLFVDKKDGSKRMCVDYSELNHVTTVDRYPIPLISSLARQLSKAKVYTKIDLKEAYYLIRVKEQSEWKTAFITPFGLFEFLVMPFGLRNAPAVFQRFIEGIFRDLIGICMFVYLDDILIYSENAEEHSQHVNAVLERMNRHNLKAKLSKCEFYVNETEYLGGSCLNQVST
jgi:hypothetical protein